MRQEKDGEVIHGATEIEHLHTSGGYFSRYDRELSGSYKTLRCNNSTAPHFLLIGIHDDLKWKARTVYWRAAANGAPIYPTLRKRIGVILRRCAPTENPWTLCHTAA